MKTISLWQPWAAAIVAGVKTIETRHWSTNYRGPIAIHAALKTSPELKRITAQAFMDGYGDAFRNVRYFSWFEMPRGAIVATAELVAVYSTDDERLNPSGKDRYWGDFSANRYGWILSGIQPLRYPLPWKGSQGLFEWTP